MRPLRRWLARVAGFLAARRREQRLRQEFEAHLEASTEDYIQSGLSPAEARRQARIDFGPVESIKESYRDQFGLPAVSGIGSDVVFGWRQLKKHPMASAVAILSLALAAGATTTAFRLVDALFLRNLPVSEPNRLFYLETTYIDREGRPDTMDDFDYPTFRRYRETLKNRADVMVVGMSARQDLLFGADQDAERVWRQFVSGNFFPVLGLKPAAGRLLMPNDDRAPGANPVAVISYDYWTRHFSRDPKAVGSTFRLSGGQYEVVGVAPEGFTGTEPGEVTDLFVPATMNVQALNSPGWSWFRTWLRPLPGITVEQIRQPLQQVFSEEQKERIKTLHTSTPRRVVDNMLNQRILVQPAGAGASHLQKEYRQPLLILSGLVLLVLLVACANVASVLTAQAEARAREMALRVSIGAGRGRLLQLLLVESLMIAMAAAGLGMLFAAWGAPAVTGMLRVPADPVRMVLETGWRELVFSLALALLVTVLFGLAPALRASTTDPIGALKGIRATQSRRPLMNTLLASQAAFSVLVLFIAGLFVSTFQSLSSRPIGFSPKHVLVLGTSAANRPDWSAIAARIREMPGVTSATAAGWPLLSGNHWTATVRLPSRADDPKPPYFLGVTPGFFETMRIGMVSGRDFRPGDESPRVDEQGQIVAGTGIVNEMFARVYFNGGSAAGRVVHMLQGKDKLVPLEILGVVRDAAYGDLREAIRPTVFVPIGSRANATLLVRTAVDPLMLAPSLRRAVGAAQSGLHVRQVELQENFVRWHLMRERLLASLSGFFALVALILAAIGLYGVLNSSVTLQRREIGIRIALGAQSGEVVKSVTIGAAWMLTLGGIAGLLAGVASSRLVEKLLFNVKGTDPAAVAVPILVLAATAAVAGLPPALRAVRTDPAETLRSE
ncbi:ADOP family duplicated permease [uncultured Paludibaculum sp.]|uniref:ADOP family duplicated permease n=1 Tax=uncultured Paludibaculum sp. TaxID=1765020 RepID=UPI002AAB1FFF|nr:ADOP family duplicated permease [uncultured Paludibaculum sp.]